MDAAGAMAPREGSKPSKSPTPKAEESAQSDAAATPEVPEPEKADKVDKRERCKNEAGVQAAFRSHQGTHAVGLHERHHNRQGRSARISKKAMCHCCVRFATQAAACPSAGSG